MELFKILRACTLTGSVLALLFICIGMFSPAWLMLKVTTPLGDTSMSVEVDIGLFSTVACVDTGTGESCRSATMEEIAEAVTASGSAQELSSMNLILGNVGPLKYLMIFGLIFTIAGIATLFIYFREAHVYGKPMKKHGIISTVSFGLAALLVFAAVAAEGHQNSNMSNSIDAIKQTLKTSASKLSGYQTSNLQPDDDSSVYGDVLGSTTFSPSDVYNALTRIDFEVLSPWAVIMSGLGASLCVLVQLAVGLWMCQRHDDTNEWHEFSNKPGP